MPQPTQIINGQSYVMYSPEWYAARDASQVHQGSVAGQTAGTQAGQAKVSEFNVTHPGQQYGAAETQALSALQSHMGSVPSSGGGNFSGGVGAPTSFPSMGAPPQGAGATPPQAQIAPPSTAEANANAFARSKDQVGLQTRGALTGLAGAMAGRGTVGSGVEGRAQAGVINQGQQQLGEVSRAQSINDATLAQKNAELAYSGAITQRGQDISHADTANSQMLASRGQDMSYAQGSRGQDITQQGQMMANNQASAELALKQLMAQYGKVGY